MKKQFQSKSVPRGTRTIWRYLGALFILFTFAIGNVWAALPLTAMPEGTNLLTSASGALTTWSTGTKNQVIYDDNNYFMAWSNGNNLEIDGTGIKIGNSKKKSALVFYVANPSDISVGIARNGSDMTASLHYMGTSMSALTDPNSDSDGGGTKCDELEISASATSGTLTKTSGAAGYYKVFGTLRFYATSITITENSGGGGGGSDTEAPTLASSVPANSATNVDVAGNIVLTMSENVTIADASKFSISGGSGSLTTASITASGKNVTIPYTGLANSTAYTLTVAANAIQDGAATPNKNAAFSISFTTAAPVVEPDYLLINQSNGNINTTHFRYTGSSSEKSGGYTVDGTKYNRYTQLGGAFTTPVGVKETNKIVSYDAKTNSVTAEAWIFNKASSTDYKFYISMIEEGTKTPTIKEFDAPQNSGTKVSWTFTPTKNATIYLTVGNNSNVHVCQFGITENGTDLLRGGQIGYSVRLDSCRLANNKNATPFVMDGISYLATSNSVNIWTPGYPVKLKATTEYIKFTLPEKAKVSIKASGTYSVTKTAEYSAGASMSGNQDVNLAADTWYICPNGSNVTFASLEFLTPDVANAVTYSAGEGSVKEGKSLPTQADAVAGEKFNLASGENLERSGYDFKGWKANGTGDLLLAGSEYTMGSAAVEFVAQWDVHVAKYGVKFMDGATKLDSLSVTIGEAPVFANPTKALNSFAGWKDGEDNVVTLSDLATSVTVEDTKLVLYAQWNKVYAADGTVNFADDNNSGALADFLPAGYACGNLDGSKNSVWGKESEGDAYFGYKLRHSGAYVELRVVAKKRVTFTFGNYAQAGTIKVGEAAAETCTLTDSKYVVDTDAEAVIRFTTTSDGTVTLKSIMVGEIPALSDDATLSDLTVGGTTVAGFVSSTLDYYVELPYGTSDAPTVAGDAHDTKAISVTPTQASTLPGNATVVVLAEDNSTTKTYTVHFTVAPKLGVELIKATHTGTTTASKEGYWTTDVTVDKKTQSKKMGADGDYFGLTLAGGKTFKNNDIVVIYLDPTQNPSAWLQLFKDKGTNMIADVQSGVKKGANYITLAGLPEEGIDKLYLYRTTTATSNMNPYVDYIAVYRQMAPFIESFKIGEVAGTISGTNIAIELPYGTSLYGVAATIEAYANGGATVIAPTPLAYDTPLGYKVSSAYAEDGDVDYTVTITEAEHYEAKIGETGYATLVAAVEAAQDGDVIVLQEDVTNGAGVMLTKTDAKEITIDFGGYTYTAVSPAVGSAGTQNQAFHLEKGNTVTLKNGTITSSGSEIKMLIQNYCDLTLENIVLDGSGLEGAHRYVMSNNCGNVEIGDGTTITAKDGDVAFDVCATNYYPEGVTVTVKEGATISGIVEYDVWGTKPADNHAELAIEGGNFDVTWNVEAALAEDAKDNLNVSGGTFTAAVPADYCAEGYAPTSWTVGTETKYGVHLAGVIRATAAQDANHGNAYAVTLDNGVVVISSNSDGKFDTNNQFDNSAADAAVALGADAGKYRYKGQHILLKFPVNVNEFTIYSYDNNTTDRKINKVTVGDDPVNVKLKNNDAIGTYTFTNNTTTKLRTMTATMTDDEIIASDKYVYVGLSNAHTVFRILFTEAPCVDPVINSTNATRVKVTETATVSVDATALGATYQWYRCDNAAGDNAVIIPGATAASYSFTKAAGDEYFKVVVGNNCNDVKVEAVVKAEVWTKLELADVTGNTSWSWAGVADGEVKINDVANKGLVLANYIDAPNFDKLEGHENARAYRSNDYPAYQGTSLKFHTTVAGAVIMDVRTGSGSFDLSVNGTVVGEITATRSIQAMYVGAGDVLISATDGEFRIYNMEFKLDNDLEPARTDEWLAPGELGTICIPQGAVAVGADIYELVGKEPQYGKIVFETVEHMKPGKPYLFQAKGNRIDFILTDEALASEPDNSGAMKGTFAEITLTGDELENVYYFADHALWSCVDLTATGLLVPANRAYVKMDQVQELSNPNPAPGRRRVVLGVHGEQVVTGVENLNASEQPVKMIIDGKLYILRGEKMFDATGRLVK